MVKYKNMNQASENFVPPWLVHMAFHFTKPRRNPFYYAHGIN